MINAPLKAVYQTLINVDKRPEWLDGVDTINREMTSERIGMRHNCVFHGLKLINTALYRDFHEDHALYSEKVEIPEIKLTLQAHYEMEALDEGSTRLRFNVNWMGATLPAEKKQGMMAGLSPAGFGIDRRPDVQTVSLGFAFHICLRRAQRRCTHFVARNNVGFRDGHHRQTQIECRVPH